MMTASKGTIVFHPCIGHSPAWPLVFEAMAELNASGLNIPPAIPPAWDDACLAWVEEDGTTTAFMAYRHDQMRELWFILLAYVAPQTRRKGVHTALFQALVERARQKGNILSIEAGTHAENHSAQAAFEAQGRKRIGVYYEYRIKPHSEGQHYLDACP